MINQQPIGILDSGVGGLSVLAQLRQLLPDKSLIYFADEAHLPYGIRSRDEIRGFVAEIVQFLIDQGCKLIVIACNAANAAALHWLRERYPDVPIVGMEPAIKPAAEATKTGVIGVITTQVTFQGELFASVIDRFARTIRVETQVCPKLVLLVEAGAPDTLEAHMIVADYLQPLHAAGIDQLVIGCTHFTFLTDHLRRFLGDGVQIVDPAPAVARQTQRVLAARGWLCTGQDGQTMYYTSGDAAHLEALVIRFLGNSADRLDIREITLTSLNK